mmetsp:Transcript_5368/g.17643  ORF Transcript_5368/g.17643 Transcript_5368/m.17643 type:complete len:467 (+) Transcript_5368:894-2294(+)
MALACSRCRLGRRVLLGKNYLHSLRPYVMRCTLPPREWDPTYEWPRRRKLARARKQIALLATLYLKCLREQGDFFASGSGGGGDKPERSPSYLPFEGRLVIDAVSHVALRTSDVETFATAVAWLPKLALAKGVGHWIVAERARSLAARTVVFWGHPLRRKDDDKRGDQRRQRDAACASLVAFISQCLVEANGGCRENFVAVLDFSSACLAARLRRPTDDFDVSRELQVAATIRLAARFAFVDPEATRDALVAARVTLGLGFGGLAVNARALDVLLADLVVFEKTTQNQENLAASTLDLDDLATKPPLQRRRDATHAKALERIEAHARDVLAPKLLDPPGILPPATRDFVVPFPPPKAASAADEATAVVLFFLLFPRAQPAEDVVQKRLKDHIDREAKLDDDALDEIWKASRALYEYVYTHPDCTPQAACRAMGIDGAEHLLWVDSDDEKQDRDDDDSDDSDDSDDE